MTLARLWRWAPAAVLALVLAAAPSWARQDDPPAEAAPFSLTPDQERIGKLLGALSRHLSDYSSKVPGLDLQLDLQALEDGELGADYDVRYQLDLSDPATDLGNGFSLSLASQGFISTEDESNRDSLVTEGRLSWQLFKTGIDPGSYARQLDRRAALAQTLDRLDALDPFDPEDLEKGKAMLREIDEIGPYLAGEKAARFLWLDAHLKSEGSQDFEDHQWAIGAGLATDLAIITGDYSIAKVLDAPFQALRSPTNPFVAQLPRLYLGYDFVTDVDVDAREALTEDGEYHRVNVQAVWKTSILDDVDLRFSWQALYELDAPDAVEDAGKDFASYFEFSAAVPVGMKGAQVFMKFSEGELPPTLRQDTQVGGGLRIEF